MDFGRKQKKHMTNYIVNKTTVEVFAAVADTLKEALAMVEKGNGTLMNLSVSYNPRPQAQVASSQTQPNGIKSGVSGMRTAGAFTTTETRPTPAVAPKKLQAKTK